jgi:hypothetical protein
MREKECSLAPACSSYSTTQIILVYNAVHLHSMYAFTLIDCLQDNSFIKLKSTQFLTDSQKKDQHFKKQS